MADEVRVYQAGGLFDAVFSTLAGIVLIPVFLIVLEALLTGDHKGGNWSIEGVRVFQFTIAALFVLVIVSMWVSVFLKLPRLELTSRSIKYLTFTYSLEAVWEDIERIEMFTRTRIRRRRRFLKWDKWERGTVDIGRGLVASKYSLHVTKWGRLFETFGYPSYHGIQIEPAFAANIYIGELAMDMKQYLPHLFEVNPYLV